MCAGKDTTPQEAMQSGLWVPCDPVPGAITVNIGDALQYWTDGRLKSTFHRVRMPRKDEYQASTVSMQVVDMIACQLWGQQLECYAVQERLAHVVRMSAMVIMCSVQCLPGALKVSCS